eukprot:g22177.t1
MRGSKKPSVEELLPLRLVGDFCSWQVEVPGLELQSNGSLMGGKVLEFILLLQLEDRQMFGPTPGTHRMGASEANGLVGGSGDGHGRNFIISDLKVKALLVRLALGKRGMEGPPLAAQVCFTLEPTRSGPTVAIGAGKVSLVGQTHVAWSDDPEQLRLQQLLPLPRPWQGHSLCMRLLTREVEFQIVSDKFGFAWRVFPGGTAKLPQCDGPSAALPAQQGGKDSAVITLLVWLNVEDEQFEEEEANESQSILGGATEGLNDEGSASDDGDDAPALEDGVVEGDPLLISDSEVAAEEDELFGDQDEEVSAADRTEKVLNEADLAIATLKAEEEAYQVFLSEQDEHAYKEFLAEQDSGMAGDLMKVNKETAEKAASELPVGEVPESGHEVVGAVAAAMEVAEPSASASSLHDLDHGEGEEDEKQVQNEMPTLDVSLNILPALQLVEPGPQLPESCGGRVQYPVLSQLTPLGPELLEAAETEDEKQAGQVSQRRPIFVVQISDFAPRGTDWGAMHPESRAPIPRRAYPEGPVLKAAASSPVVPAREAPKKADEVEAERLWWSDYCEQKLQEIAALELELQESFSKELRRLTERMQADLRFTEDRLAAQVESEKDARQASVGDLRRESDHQSVEMSEIVRSQASSTRSNSAEFDGCMRRVEEQRSLHQVISQSAGDLGRGIEELSAALMHSEQQWRAETGKLEQQLRAELEDGAGVAARRQWTQGLHDERDSRGRELEIFKSLMEAANHRLDQVERDTSAQDVQKLLGRVEETQNDLTQLQAEQRLLQAECRRAPRAPAREEGQERARGRRQAFGSWRLRVEALESMIEAQVPKSLQLESQVKELRNTVSPFLSRIQALENQARRSNLETAPLQARLQSVEAEVLKLTRESHDWQTLRSDVEALKRRALTSSEPPRVAERRSSLGNRSALLPKELRENISHLVHRVSETVSNPLPGDEAHSDSASIPNSAGARSGSDLPIEQLQQQLREGMVSQEGYQQALQAIQELREPWQGIARRPGHVDLFGERNLTLREKNAELVEEMLGNAGDTRSSIQTLPTWAPADQILVPPELFSTGHAPTGPAPTAHAAHAPTAAAVHAPTAAPAPVPALAGSGLLPPGAPFRHASGEGLVRTSSPERDHAVAATARASVSPLGPVRPTRGSSPTRGPCQFMANPMLPMQPGQPQPPMSALPMQGQRFPYGPPRPP